LSYFFKLYYNAEEFVKQTDSDSHRIQFISISYIDNKL